MCYSNIEHHDRMVANKQELEEANKQQFRKERDNKGGTRRSMAIFALNTL